MRRQLAFGCASFFVLFVSLSFNNLVFAQQTTGDIAGTVTDSTGAVLPDVTITAVSVGTNASRSTVTNDTGAFRIPELAIGAYRVTASAEGFKSAVQTVNVLSGAVMQSSSGSRLVSDPRPLKLRERRRWSSFRPTTTTMWTR